MGCEDATVTVVPAVLYQEEGYRYLVPGTWYLVLYQVPVQCSVLILNREHPGNFLKQKKSRVLQRWLPLYY